MNTEILAYPEGGQTEEAMYFDPRVAVMQSEFSMPEEKSAAFGELVNELSPLLNGVVRKIISSHDDTQDIVQETFERGLTHIDRYKPTGKFSSWMTRIAINKAIDMLRKQGRRPVEFLEDSIDPTLQFTTLAISEKRFLNPEEAYEQAERQEKLLGAIATLSPAKQAIMELNLQDIETEKIAEKLDISPTTVRTGIFKANKKLREHFTKEDFN